MERRPLDDEAQRPGRKTPSQHGEILDADNGFDAAVFGMEMSRSVSRKYMRMTIP